MNHTPLGVRILRAFFLLAVAVLFLVLTLLGCGGVRVETEDGVRMSRYSFRDIGDGSSVVRLNNSQYAIFVIDWEARTVCETGTKHFECWTSTYEGVSREN